MPFDVEGARKAGYSNEEIASHLAETSNFDVKGALDAGYSYDEIIPHLDAAQTPPQAETLPGAEVTNPTPRTWGGALAEAPGNVPRSTGQLMKDMVQPIIHPINTASNLTGIITGLVQKISPGEQDNEKYADAAINFLKERYGGEQEIMKTLATDPAGMLADISLFLSGGGGAMARLPGTLGKVGEVAATAGRLSDPVNALGKAAALTGKVGKEAGTWAVGELGTRTGKASIDAAIDAGERGATSFKDNMRGEVDPADVVEAARTGVQRAREDRSADYRGRMAVTASNQAPISFQPINDALRDAAKIGQHRGHVTDQTAKSTYDTISLLVDDFRQDPSVHNAIGLDALKQAIGDVYSDGMSGKAKGMITGVQQALKKEIGRVDPSYAGTMKGYEKDSVKIQELESSLTGKSGKPMGPALKRLQRSMKDPTQYSAKLLDDIEQGYGIDLKSTLAGQSLQGWLPHGLVGGAEALGTLGAAAVHPAALAALPFQSRRLVGEAAYAGGAAARELRKLRDKLGITGEGTRKAADVGVQLGRMDDYKRGGRVVGFSEGGDASDDGGGGYGQGMDSHDNEATSNEQSNYGNDYGTDTNPGNGSWSYGGDDGSWSYDPGTALGTPDEQLQERMYGPGMFTSWEKPWQDPDAPGGSLLGGLGDWAKGQLDKSFTTRGVTNLAFGAVPVAGTLNTLSGLFGGPTVGDLTQNIKDTISNGMFTNDMKDALGLEHVNWAAPNEATGPLGEGQGSNPGPVINNSGTVAPLSSGLPSQAAPPQAPGGVGGAAAPPGRTFIGPSDAAKYFSYGQNPFEYYAQNVAKGGRIKRAVPFADGGHVGATHETSYNASGNETKPWELEGFGNKWNIGTAPRGSVLPSLLQGAYDLKTLPFYATPFAPLAAGVDMTEGVTSGDPLQAGLSALGVPGKALRLAAPVATVAAEMAPDPAQAGGMPTKPFFSKLEQVLGELKGGKAPMEQWLSTLKNRGVRPEELDWTLQRNNPFADKPVTLDELKAHVAENKVLPDEKIMGGDRPPTTEELDNWAQERMGADNYASLGPSDQEEVMRDVVEDNIRWDSVNDATKYAEYQLPGGENYKEMLLTLPPKSSGKSLEEFTKDYLGKDFSELTASEQANMRAEHAGSKTDNTYTSSHFDEPNILAHVRFNDRVSPDGKKTLFLEEVQSDWHQAGRKKGYNKPGKEWEVFDPSNGTPIASYDTEAEALAHAQANPELDYDRTNLPKGVPDAPLKKNWHEMAMKRMLNYAAENGYDRIAWTKGSQQVDRYQSSLRKAVDEIHWEKTPEGIQLKGYKGTDQTGVKELETERTQLLRDFGNGPLTPEQAVRLNEVNTLLEHLGRNPRSQVIDTTHKEDQLSDAVGKAIGEQIIKDPGQSGIIKGDDLKIDDTGMAGFYDKILPRTVEALGKKHGVKVGTTTLPGGRDTGWVSGGTVMDEMGIPAEKQEDYWKNLTQPEREDLIDKHRSRYNTHDVHSVDITPGLREAARKGFPFFSAGAGVGLSGSGNRSEEDNQSSSLDEQIKKLRRKLQE